MNDTNDVASSPVVTERKKRVTTEKQLAALKAGRGKNEN